MKIDKITASMDGGVKIEIGSRKIIKYIKIFLIVTLVIIEAVICAQTFGNLISDYTFFITVACCVALTGMEIVNAFVITKFVAKMVFYGLDSALILAICVLTGNSFMSTIYCIVLTQCYISVEKFRDKTILFGVSCGIFSVSFIVGCIINSQNISELDVITGLLFGLLALVIDYIVCVFLLKFYKTNLALTAALKEAGESRAKLNNVYEELTQTKAAKLLIDDDPAEAKNRIISANVQARNALEQMRESVHLLAGRVQTKPLKDEVEEIIAATIDGTDLKARFDLDDVHPSAEVYRFIVNSLKELLSNGIRHGKATAFYVELKGGDGISLLVSDNGGGVSDDVKEGFGLRGIRENAEKLGGTCNFTSEDGEGFEAHIFINSDEGVAE